MDRTYLLDSLRSVQRRATAIRGAGGPGDPHQRLLAYLEWANFAVRLLGNQISDSDLRALVLNRMYDQLFSLLSGISIIQGISRGANQAVIDLVDLEVNQRVEAFDAAIKELEAYQERWSGLGDLLILDTNFYVEHPAELRDTDLAALTAAVTPGWAMHVLVPLLVVDELDGLKRHNETKTRARSALKMLDEVFKRVSQDSTMGMLRKADDTPSANGSIGLGPITMELLFDPPDHERLPVNDAEIVDRALAVQTLAGRPVTMVTYDKNMSFRARYAGLQAISPPYPERNEEQGRSRGGRGGARQPSSDTT
jgi:hypothetical protein